MDLKDADVARQSRLEAYIEIMTDMTVEERREIFERAKLRLHARYQEFLDNLPVEKRLASLTPAQRLAGLKPEQLDELLEIARKAENLKAFVQYFSNAAEPVKKSCR